MKTQRSISLTNISPAPFPPRVLLAILKEPEHTGQTDLITRLALRGPFHLIAGGEWLPNQDTLRRSVHRYTTAVDETLDHPILGRPSTFLQLRDQLENVISQNRLILVLDFLHLFYVPDVDFSLRLRILKECCEHVHNLSRSKSVIILVRCLPVPEYQEFFPSVASIADEILEIQEDDLLQVSQPSLLGKE